MRGTGLSGRARSGRLPSWWWPGLAGTAGVLAGLAAAGGYLEPAAAAVVVGAAVVSAPARPHKAAALISIGALAGVAVAAAVDRPAALAGVAVAAAVAQFGLSSSGRARAKAAGLVTAAIAGTLALRSANLTTVGAPVEGLAAGVLILAALAAAFLVLPARRGQPAAPTGAIVVAALSVSALGVTGGGNAVAAASLVGAVALAFDRRPAAALVAAPVACTASPALAGGSLALTAAAVVAALASVGSTEGDAGTVGPWWISPAVALPAAATVLNMGVGRSFPAVLAALAVAVAVGFPLYLDRSEVMSGSSPRLPFGLWPAGVLAAFLVVVPGRVAWLGDPLDQWPAGAALALVGMGLATAALRLGLSRTSRTMKAPPPTRPAVIPTPPPAPRPGSLMG